MLSSGVAAVASRLLPAIPGTSVATRGLRGGKTASSGTGGRGGGAGSSGERAGGRSCDPPNDVYAHTAHKRQRCGLQKQESACGVFRSERARRFHCSDSLKLI